MALSVRVVGVDFGRQKGLYLRRFQSLMLLTFSWPLIHAIRCYTQQSYHRKGMQVRNESAFIFSLQKLCNLL